MVYPANPRKRVVILFCALLGGYASGQASGADAEDANPLRFYKGPGNSFLQATIKVQGAYFGQDNSWFGESKANLGEKSGNWWESAITAGVEGSYFFSSGGEIYGRVSGVNANTSRIDAAGSNVGLDDVSHTAVEDAYLGWRSGDLFGTFGKDFIDMSFGRQQYVVGNGFLFYNESSNGQDRGAFWLGERRAADFAGIIRFNYKQLKADLVYLNADDNPDTNTRVGGITLDYSFGDLGGVGGGYYRISSDLDIRDSMDVFDVRFDVNPLASLPNLKFQGEFVHESNDNSDDGNGWYLSAGYNWDKLPWQPTLTYRYASFDDAYDPLFYGFYDWAYWYQGEILGEYVLSNSNLNSHMLLVNLKPIDSISVNLFYYNFRLDDANAFGVESKSFANEWDLAVDWTYNDHLTFSLVGALADPQDGAKEYTGGDDNWSYGMVYAKISF